MFDSMLIICWLLLIYKEVTCDCTICFFWHLRVFILNCIHHKFYSLVSFKYSTVDCDENAWNWSNHFEFSHIHQKRPLVIMFKSLKTFFRLPVIVGGVLNFSMKAFFMFIYFQTIFRQLMIYYILCAMLDIQCYCLDT